MQIEKIKIDRLKAAEYNPRKDLKPGDAEFEKLRRSIEEFGYVEPAIWNKRTGNIVGGHQRIKVLKHLGHTEADCVVIDIDETQEKALNIALNKISGSWDEGLLTTLLKDLEHMGYDLTLTGFDVSETSELFGKGAIENAHEDDFDANKAIEEAFIRALNGIIQDRNEIMDVVGKSVNEALSEAGEDIDRSDELRDLDEQIEILQARILGLNKQRGKREIDGERYNSESREVMDKLDKLFIDRDVIISERSTATLSKAFQALIADILSKAGEQAEFDRDIFTKLVDFVRIKSREDIIFILKDGTEVRGEIM